MIISICSIQRHGQGVYANKDKGVIYEGLWDSDKYHGQGSKTYPNGSVYTGTPSLVSLLLPLLASHSPSCPVSHSLSSLAFLSPSSPDSLSPFSLCALAEFFVM